MVNSPSLRSPSAGALKNSISSKQQRLTESLIIYSKELFSKIPQIIAKWKFENHRLLAILNKKKYLLNLKNSKNLKDSTQNSKSQILKLESENLSEQEKLENLCKNLENLKNRKNDWEKIDKNLKFLAFHELQLQDKLKKIRNYKKVSENNLDELGKNSIKLRKIIEMIEERREEIDYSSEDLNRSENLLDIEWNKAKCKRIRWNEEFFKRNIRVGKEVEELKGRLKRIEMSNMKKKFDLKSFKEKIEANSAMIRLENRYVDERRKRIRNVDDWIKIKIQELKNCN